MVIGRVLQTETLSRARPMIFFRGGFGIDSEHDDDHSRHSTGSR